MLNPVLCALDRANSSTPLTSRSSTPYIPSRTPSQASLKQVGSTQKYVRSKSRLREEEDKDRGSRKKVDSKSELAQAINGITGEMVMDRKRREARDALQDQNQKAPERAIEVLYKAYESRMADLDFIKVLNMLDREKSGLFLLLKVGGKRDLWVKRTFDIELWQEIKEEGDNT
jgi:hypothetical protein